MLGRKKLQVPVSPGVPEEAGHEGTEARLQDIMHGQNVKLLIKRFALPYKVGPGPRINLS